MSQPMELTAGQMIEQMPNAFLPEAAQNITATYQLDLSGEGGGIYWVKVSGGYAASGEGKAENPTVTMKASAEDFIRLATGQLSPTAAVMERKLRITGDMYWLLNSHPCSVDLTRHLFHCTALIRDELVVRMLDKMYKT